MKIIVIPRLSHRQYASVLPEEMHSGLLETLALDPRPGYQHDEMRTYGILYAGYNVTFQVGRDNLVVTGIEKAVR